MVLRSFGSETPSWLHSGTCSAFGGGEQCSVFSYSSCTPYTIQRTQYQKNTIPAQVQTLVAIQDREWCNHGSEDSLLIRAHIQHTQNPTHTIHAQVQTLMAIQDREWCNLYYWSEERGSIVAHIKRDREYFSILHEVSLSSVGNDLVCKSTC